MTVCHLYDDDWELLQLGALDAATSEEMREHIRTGCAACAARFAEATHLLGAMGASLGEVEPPAHIEMQLRRRLKATPAPARVLVEPVATTQPVSPRQVLTRVAAALVLVVGGALAVQNVGMRRDLDAAQQQLASVTPAVTPPASAARASAPEPAPNVAPEPPSRASSPQALPDVEPWRRERQRLESAIAQAEAGRREAEADVARLDLALVEARRTAPAPASAAAPALVPVVPEDQGGAADRLAGLQAIVVQLTTEVRRLEADARRQAEVSREYLAAMQGALDDRATRITLRAIDPAAGRAAASATVTPDGRVLLVARGLPVLPPDKCYQLWVIRRDNPAIMSAGVVTVSGQGQALHSVRVGGAGGPITGFALTDEPLGGSVESRGRKLLFGSVS